MGVLNVTPDSFSDGGRFSHLDAALAHAGKMVDEGVDIIDIGGESTRPGAGTVSDAEELDRVIPVIERLTAEFDSPVSVDTSKAIVMREAVNAGAGMINDVCALQADGALAVVAKLNVPVCLMHMQGAPRSMQSEPAYDDVTGEVLQFLLERIAAATAAGISGERLFMDPGFGFGKTLDHNLQLLRNLQEFTQTGHPVLVGVSRKSMIGQLTGRPVDQRLAGSLGAAMVAVQKGAAVLRVHDVGPTVDILNVWKRLA